MTFVLHVNGNKNECCSLISVHGVDYMNLSAKKRIFCIFLMDQSVKVGNRSISLVNSAVNCGSGCVSGSCCGLSSKERQLIAANLNGGGRNSQAVVKGDCSAASGKTDQQCSSGCCGSPPLQDAAAIQENKEAHHEESENECCDSGGCCSQAVVKGDCSAASGKTDQQCSSGCCGSLPNEDAAAIRSPAKVGGCCTSRTTEEDKGAHFMHDCCRQQLCEPGSCAPHSHSSAGRNHNHGADSSGRVCAAPYCCFSVKKCVWHDCCAKGTCASDGGMPRTLHLYDTCVASNCCVAREKSKLKKNDEMDERSVTEVANSMLSNSRAIPTNPSPGQTSSKNITDLRLTKFRVTNLCCHKEIDLCNELLGDKPGIISIQGHVLSRSLSVKYDSLRISTETILDILNATRLGVSVQEAVQGSEEENVLQIPFDFSGMRCVAAYGFFAMLATVLLLARPQLTITLNYGQLVAIGVLFAAGDAIVVPAFRSIQNKRIDMFVLMSAALAGAVVSGAIIDAAELVAMFHVGNFITAEVMRQISNKLSVLAASGFRPSTCVGADGQLKDVAQLRVGDEVLVRAGDCVPVDGVIIEGRGSVDEASLTGESLTIEKSRHDEVYGGTICQNGFMKVRCKATFQNSLCRTLIDSSAALRQDKLTATQQFVDQFASYFTPYVLAAAFALFFVGISFFQWTWVIAVQRASFLLVLGCPCALLLATPMPSGLFVAYAASLGVIVKSAAVMENLTNITSVIFDKTGTLTDGLFKVSPAVFFAVPEIETSQSPTVMRFARSDKRGNSLLLEQGATKGDVMKVVASLEAQSTHPIAVAIMRQQFDCLAEAASAASDADGGVAGMYNVKKFKLLPGNRGCCGTVSWKDGYTFDVVVGATDAVLPMLNENSLQQSTHMRFKEWQDAHKGFVQVVCAFDGEFVCALALFDYIRPTAHPAVQELRQKLGVEVGILSGDKASVVHSVATQLGLQVNPYVIEGGMTPALKREFIIRAQKTYKKKVLMTGDGVNDVPALSAATVSLAVGPGGSTQAGEAADAVLIAENILTVPSLLRLARHSMKVVHGNIFIALFCKALGALYILYVGDVALWIAVLADVSSLLAVVLFTLVSMHFAQPTLSEIH